MAICKYSALVVFFWLFSPSVFTGALAETISDTERLYIERACEKLGVKYTHYVDLGEAEKVPELFTKDGIWEYDSLRLVGEEQIRSFFLKQQNSMSKISRHVVTNYLVEVVDSNHARGTSYMVVFRHTGELSGVSALLENQPSVVGEYQDEYVKVDNVWKIKRRKAIATFVQQSNVQQLKLSY